MVCSCSFVPAYGKAGEMKLCPLNGKHMLIAKGKVALASLRHAVRRAVWSATVHITVLLYVHLTVFFNHCFWFSIQGDLHDFQYLPLKPDLLYWSFEATVERRDSETPRSLELLFNTIIIIIIITNNVQRDYASNH